MPQIDMPVDKLQTYTGTNPRPDDFDHYWDTALEDVTAHMTTADFAPRFVPSTYAIPGFRFADLFFTGVGGATIHARCVFPETPGPKPAVLKFHGYSGNAGDWALLLPFAAAGAAIFALDVRGQGGASTDPGGVPGSTLYGHIVRGLDGQPEELFYRGVFLDTVALARIAFDHEEVDATRVATYGGSQGGALAVACAGLEPRISRCVSVYPFLSDYKRVWQMDLGQRPYQELRDYFRRFDPRHQRVDATFTRLGYIDIQNLAPRITGETVMVTGLMDEICPPSTQFAVYNKIQSNKRMYLYPDFGHEAVPEQVDLALRFLCRLDGS